MRMAWQTTAMIAFASSTFGTAAFAQGSAFETLAALHETAAIPTLAMASTNESWAGKCAVVNAPDQLAGGIEHFFVNSDPVLGDRIWAVETLYLGDEAWPTRATIGQLQSERRRAADAATFYEQLAAGPAGLTTRYFVRNPNGSVEDVAYTLRRAAGANGSAYWILRVDCNLNECVPLDGRGPILRHGDAIAYCYFNQQVLPATPGH